MSQADELQARADAFADLSLRFVEGLPHTDRARRLAGQYQDASTSTAANYRAARTRENLRHVAPDGKTSAQTERHHPMIK